jgi:hypothetical protein
LQADRVRRTNTARKIPLRPLLLIVDVFMVLNVICCPKLKNILNLF